ncbi:MAG TPA: hypothetical protein PLA58_06640, partial [Smithellaceae bacterium]|nr:hypothetical protein [Smithellaceae bacterium]HPV72587.1 hypothetical protein [Smithellaceae bacterium]
MNDIVFPSDRSFYCHRSYFTAFIRPSAFGLQPFYSLQSSAFSSRRRFLVPGRFQGYFLRN